MQPFDDESIEDFIKRFINHKSIVELHPDIIDRKIFLKIIWKSENYKKNKNEYTTISK